MSQISTPPIKSVLESSNKPYIIEHINEEHQDDLVAFAQMYSQSKSSIENILTTDQENITHKHIIKQANIIDIYQQGIDLQIEYENEGTTVLFLEFPESISSIEEMQLQYIAMKQQIDELQGKDSIKLVRKDFVLCDKYMITDNMLRLVLSADDSTLKYQNSAGYAYLFDLKIDNTENNNISRDHCYYTLRKVFSENDKTLAWIDVYLHIDKSKGSLASGGEWSKALAVGDHVVTKRQFPEKIDHLSQGQVLLISDETSMPTVARLLELWDNPVAPIIVSITNDKVEQNYLQGQYLQLSEFAKDFTILPVVIEYDQTDLASKIDQVVAGFIAEHNVKINKVWGAMEATTIKEVRRCLIERLGLSRADCVLKVYWRKD